MCNNALPLWGDWVESCVIFPDSNIFQNFTAIMSNVVVFTGFVFQSHTAVPAWATSAQHSQTLPPAYCLITLSFWPKCQKLLILMRLVLLSSAKGHLAWEGLTEFCCQCLVSFANSSHQFQVQCQRDASWPRRLTLSCFLPPPLLPEPANLLKENQPECSVYYEWHSSHSKMNWLLVETMETTQ